jgi:hypothetical protein
MTPCRYTFWYYSHIFFEILRKSTETCVRIVGLIVERVIIGDLRNKAEQWNSLGFLMKTVLEYF